MHVLTVVGTRPEAIKMAPLVLALQRDHRFQHTLCTTGQHTDMLTPVLSLFGLVPDMTLDVMHERQTLNSLTARILLAMDDVIRQSRPDLILVHGDTTTAMAAALAGFHAKCEIAHIEAGLRTGDLSQPFPEEMNRCVIDTVSRFLFAPTSIAKDYLSRSQLTGQCWVTGNTVIDALSLVCQLLDDDPSVVAPIERRFEFLDPHSKLILVTGHRRENFGQGLSNICEALKELAKDPNIQIVYPVHLNPNVQTAVRGALSNTPNIYLVPPTDYPAFVWLMRRAHVILTDSGGVQEEAPHLKKPVLVMRDVTERPEAIANGTAKLVGTHVPSIVRETRRLLKDPSYYNSFCKSSNPYGDGLACERIVRALCNEPVQEFDIAALTQPVFN